MRAITVQKQITNHTVQTHLDIVEIDLVAVLDLVQVVAFFGEVALLVLEGACQRHLLCDTNERRARVDRKVGRALGMKRRPVDGAAIGKDEEHQSS